MLAHRVICLFSLLSLSCSQPEPPGRFDVVETTIAEIHEALRSGQTSCREVVKAYLNRIEAYDGPTGLNAITVVNPRALERAEDIDTALREGRELGPLFCAPILVKDNLDTHDLPTTGGSVA